MLDTKVATPMTEITAARPALALRGTQLLGAAASGGLLGYLATSIAAWGAASQDRACAGSTAVCLTLYVPGAALLVVVLVLAGYLAVAYLLRVPHPIPVSCAAWVLAGLLHYYAVAVAPLQRPPVSATVLLTAFALVVVVALRLWPTRSGVAALVVALLAAYVGQGPCRDYLAEHHTQQAVQRTGLPQLNPSLPGYRLLRDFVPVSGDAIVYELASTTAPLDDYSKEYGYIPTAITVQISRIPATFRPPTDCQPPQPLPRLNAPCSPTGDGRWTMAGPGPVELVEEHQGVLIAAYTNNYPVKVSTADLTRALDSAFR